MLKLSMSIGASLTSLNPLKLTIKLQKPLKYEMAEVTLIVLYVVRIKSRESRNFRDFRDF